MGPLTTAGFDTETTIRPFNCPYIFLNNTGIIRRYNWFEPRRYVNKYICGQRVWNVEFELIPRIYGVILYCIFIHNLWYRHIPACIHSNIICYYINRNEFNRHDYIWRRHYKIVPTTSWVQHHRLSVPNFVRNRVNTILMSRSDINCNHCADNRFFFRNTHRTMSLYVFGLNSVSSFFGSKSHPLSYNTLIHEWHPKRIGSVITHIPFCTITYNIFRFDNLIIMTETIIIELVGIVLQVIVWNLDPILPALIQYKYIPPSRFHLVNIDGGLQ